MASAEFQTLLARIAEREIKPDAPESERRADMEAFFAGFHDLGDLQREAVLAGGVAAEWITPPGAPVAPVVFYLHGGAYVRGSIVSHLDLIGRLARVCGGRALALDYRLAPEHPFPAAIEDATAAWRWLLEQDVTPGQVVLAGDSAGGGLSLAAMLQWKAADLPLPTGAVLLSPWTDLTFSGGSIESKAGDDPMLTLDNLSDCANKYLAETAADHPLASPHFADLSGLPPLQVLVGESEILLDDSLRLVERAQAAGTSVELERWPEMPHVWPAFASVLPEGETAVQRMGSFMKRVLAAP